MLATGAENRLPAHLDTLAAGTSWGLAACSRAQNLPVLKGPVPSWRRGTVVLYGSLARALASAVPTVAEPVAHLLDLDPSSVRFSASFGYLAKGANVSSLKTPHEMMSVIGHF